MADLQIATDLPPVQEDDLISVGSVLSSDHDLISITEKESFLIRLFQECLAYNFYLTSDDKNWLIDHLLVLNLSDEILATLALHSCRKQTNTGKFSLTFLDKLNSAAKARSKLELNTLITTDLNQIWPEVAVNASLTESERKSLLTQRQLEYTAFLNMIETFKLYQNLSLSEILCTFYQQCYTGICISSGQQQKQVAKDTLYFSQAEELVTTKYCFDLVQLLTSLVKQPGLNPNTLKPFPVEVLAKLELEYAAEFKIVRYYLGR